MVQGFTPGHCAGRKHPGSTRYLINGRVSVVRTPAARNDRRLREQRIAAIVGRQGIVREITIHLITFNPWDCVPIFEPRAGVHPVRAVLHYIAEIRVVADPGGVHDARECLFRTIQERIAPLHGCGCVVDGIDRLVFVTNQDAIGHATRRGLKSHLPVDGVRAEKRQVHAGVSCGYDAVIHGLRPVLVVADGQYPFERSHSVGVGVHINVRCIGHVIPHLLHPVDEVDLPIKKEVCAVLTVRAVK